MASPSSVGGRRRGGPGGVGGCARFVAICPPSVKAGRKVSGRDAPLPRSSKPLHRDERRGFRAR